MGLHERYARILENTDGSLGSLALASPSDATRKRLTEAFHGMMSALYEQKGATMDINILASDEAQRFIDTHASVLDSTFEQVEMSDTMRRRLQESDYVFSGIKTFHELKEAFPSLLDEQGRRKPFEQFLNDVQKVDETYNKNYLRAEYNFVQQSAQMAAKWEEFEEDGDRYNLQYRTAGDSKVREEHAALNGVTLPQSDPFWETYMPPNGWNCRCTVVQVRKGKYPETPRTEAMTKGVEALSGDKKGMFRFNPGKERKTIPDYNPYTIQKCKHCDVAQGKATLAYAPGNEVCAACQLLRGLRQQEGSRRLSREERCQARDAALQWANEHLPEVRIGSNQTAKRKNIINADSGDTLILSKKFFSETFAKNKNNRKLAKTMDLATKVGEWLPGAEKVGIEDGIDHAYQFAVYKATIDGVNVVCKAKLTEGAILYTMRIVE